MEIRKKVELALSTLGLAGSAIIHFGKNIADLISLYNLPRELEALLMQASKAPDILALLLLLIGLVGVAFLIYDTLKDRRSKFVREGRMVPFIGMIMFGAGFLICAAWYFIPSSAVRTMSNDNEVGSQAETQRALLPIPPAKGGDASVEGKRSMAIGGNAGESGVFPGGPGGNASVRGNDSISIGGQGGGAPQANGRAGKGGVAMAGLGYNRILPDGRRLSDFGRGGDTPHSPEYIRTHWEPLTISEIVQIYGGIKLFARGNINIVCQSDNCVDFAESLVDLFDRLQLNVKIEISKRALPREIQIQTNDIFANAFVKSISETTRGRIHPTIIRPHDSDITFIFIGEKPR